MIIKTRTLLQSLFLAALVMSNSLVKAETIEVIYNDKYYISGIEALNHQNIQVKTYNLDDARRLLNQFKKDIAPDSSLKQSKATIMQRFKSLGEARLRKKFMQAYQGVIISAKYGVKRFPVVLFNHGKQAVYGVTNLADAYDIYQRWQAGTQP